MTGAELQTKMRAGDVLHGSLITSPSPRVAQEIGKAGLHFVFVDTEHIALDREKLSFMCQCYALQGLPVIVRIPEPDPFLATMALDGGASGVMAPYIETVDQVRMLHGAVKLRPLKGARLQSAINGAPLPAETTAYLQKFNEGRLLILNIESTIAKERLPALIGAGDVDGVIIGPHDLSISLDLPERYGEDRFFTCVAAIVQKARAMGVGAGIHYSYGTAPMAAWGRLGMNIMLYSSDVTHFVEGVRRSIGEISQGMAQP